MDATERERQYWASERASYDDELDAWRERTAFAVIPWGMGFGPWARRTPASIRSLPERTAPRSQSPATTVAPVAA
jgi:hypothetical protein